MHILYTATAETLTESREYIGRENITFFVIALRVITLPMKINV